MPFQIDIFFAKDYQEIFIPGSNPRVDYRVYSINCHGSCNRITMAVDKLPGVLDFYYSYPAIS